MNTVMKQPSDHRFAIGLLAGTCVGAGLALWLAPRGAAEIRGRLNGVRDDMANAVARGAHDVARGAHDVERMAKAARS
jgi:gas vesicle protein